jgi:hypothetical protein
MNRRWNTKERRAYERQYNKRRLEPGEAQRREDNHEPSDLRLRGGAAGDSRLHPRTTIAVANDPSLPLADEVDNRIAWWFGKRLYLGHNSLISRLFWLLARRPGYTIPKDQITWETEHPGELPCFLTEAELKAAELRLRKTLSRLRTNMREYRLDDHVLIVTEPIDDPAPPWTATSGLTMIVRAAQTARRSA